MYDFNYVEKFESNSDMNAVQVSNSASSSDAGNHGVTCVGEPFVLKAHSSTFSTNLLATEKAFQEMAESPLFVDVIIDLTNVIHFNSRALRLLVDLQTGLGRRNGTLCLKGVNILTQRLFEYTRLDRFFNIELSGLYTAKEEESSPHH